MKTQDHISLDFDFLTFVNFIFANKFFIFRMILIFGIVSIIYNFAFRPIIFTSTIKIHPVNSASESVIPQSLTRMLSGVGDSNTASGKGSKDLAIITSRQFIDSFIKKRDIAKYLIAVDAYDASSQTLYFKDKLFDPETAKIKRELVNDEMLYRQFSRLLSIKTYLDSEMVNVSIQYISPFAASDMANWLIEDLNIYLANKDVIKAQRNIDFLNSTVQTSQKNYVDLDNLYHSLKLQEIKKLMLAKASTEHSYEVIDPAFPVMVKSSPRRLRDSLVGTIMGGIVALFTLIFQRIILAYRDQYSA